MILMTDQFLKIVPILGVILFVVLMYGLFVIDKEVKEQKIK